ncbi:hypothetical protein B0H17DRAFT_1027395 [Mycena rosella]|uniref:Uncharacterized protein n=1 Tax=Mycena rosella TaxID=1033263 RepID=A0AAD7H2T2_MYCRO|nr:hypothetical protein B0H17DRAFT_1027395 [Mycena rosella]
MWRGGRGSRNRPDIALPTNCPRTVCRPDPPVTARTAGLRYRCSARPHGLRRAYPHRSIPRRLADLARGCGRRGEHARGPPRGVFHRGATNATGWGAAARCMRVRGGGGGVLSLVRLCSPYPSSAWSTHSLTTREFSQRKRARTTHNALCGARNLAVPIYVPRRGGVPAPPPLAENPYHHRSGAHGGRPVRFGGVAQPELRAAPRAVAVAVRDRPRIGLTTVGFRPTAEHAERDRADDVRGAARVNAAGCPDRCDYAPSSDARWRRYLVGGGFRALSPVRLHIVLQYYHPYWR